MPPIRDEAIVLRRWDWSETSQAALLFCRAHGVMRGLAKGAKREKAPFSGGLEPLTLGEVGAIVKPSTELATLTDWDLREVFWGARRSSRGFLAGHYIADLLRYGIHDADPHPQLWSAAVEALRALETPERIDRALAKFQWALLSETGYQPDLTAVRKAPDALSRGDGSWAYDPHQGAVVEAAGAASPDVWGIRTETVSFLIGLAEPESDGADYNEETVERANRFLAACIRWSLGDAPPTMERLFGGSVFGASDPARRTQDRPAR